MKVALGPLFLPVGPPPVGGRTESALGSLLSLCWVVRLTSGATQRRDFAIWGWQFDGSDGAALPRLEGSAVGIVFAVFVVEANRRKAGIDLVDHGWKVQ